MKEIKLTQGKVALVDDEDFEKLSRYKWCAYKNGHVFYAQSTVPRNKKTVFLNMAHLVLPPPVGMCIDHIDRNGCNNQKHNLRVCSKSQNGANSESYTGISKYKGVCWSFYHKKWMSRIMLERKRTQLGYFKSEKEAALVYNVAAVRYFGEFARLNVINQVNREELLEKMKELGL